MTVAKGQNRSILVRLWSVDKYKQLSALTTTKQQWMERERASERENDEIYLFPFRLAAFSTSIVDNVFDAHLSFLLLLLLPFVSSSCSFSLVIITIIEKTTVYTISNEFITISESDS